MCRPEECPYELDCEPWEDHEGEEDLKDGSMF